MKKIEVEPDSGLKFSFRHVDFDQGNDFCLSHGKENYWPSLIQRLKDLGGISAKEFRENKSKSLRAHTLDWKDTTRTKGFENLNSQLQSVQPWQFEVSVNEHGRIHGFFIQDIFYIVWFDIRHKLYS